ncbi:MAG: ATPase [Acidiferrobacterales bacterium]
MDEMLKRLLEVELHAEKLVEEAKAKREKITRQALADARRAEERFSARVPEIRGAFMEKAQARASQTIRELQRRYDERNKELRRMGEQHERDAIETAVAMIIGPEKG